jgi:hypothetical protein
VKPPRLDIEPGAEYLLPWAKNKLAWLRAQVVRYPWWPKFQVFLGSQGERVEIDAGASPRIKITGTLSGYGWGIYLVGGKTQAAILNAKFKVQSDVGPAGKTGALSSANVFQDVASFGAPTVITTHRKRLFGRATITGAAGEVWLGFLDTYLEGGALSFGVGPLTTPAPNPALSSDEKMFLFAAFRPGVTPAFDPPTWAIYRVTLNPEKGEDGAVILHEDPVLLASSGPSDAGSDAYLNDSPTISVDKRLKNVAWAEYTPIDRPHGGVTDLGATGGGAFGGGRLASTVKHTKVITVDVEAGTRSEHISETATDAYYGLPKLGFATPITYLDYFEDLVEAKAVPASEAHDFWATTKRSRIITPDVAIDGNVNWSMWAVVTLYRGSTLVRRWGSLTDLEDGVVRTINIDPRWASMKREGVLLVDYSESQAPFYGMTNNQSVTPSLPEFKIYGPPPASGTRKLLIVEGATITFEQTIPWSTSTAFRAINADATAVLATLGSGALGISVLERDSASGTWAKHDVVQDPGATSFAAGLEVNIINDQSRAPAGMKFSWAGAANFLFFFLAEDVEWTVRKENGVWTLFKRDEGPPPPNLLRTFGDPEVYRL